MDSQNLKPIDLGGGHVLQPVKHPDGGLNGFIEKHPRPDNGESCMGVLIIKPTKDDVTYNRPVWTMESEDPITLSPSIACRTCGAHGWIREGKWVDA